LVTFAPDLAIQGNVIQKIMIQMLFVKNMKLKGADQGRLSQKQVGPRVDQTGACHCDPVVNLDQSGSDQQQS
jgi:hypothetical protein